MRPGRRAALDTSMTDARPPELLVRLTGRTAAESLPVPDGSTAHDELVRFLNRQGTYAQLWIRLGSGEYVRYDVIESIAISDPDEGQLQTSK